MLIAKDKKMDEFFHFLDFYLLSLLTSVFYF